MDNSYSVRLAYKLYYYTNSDRFGEMMTEQEQLKFYELLEKLANENDMANMTVINKAQELLNAINDL